MGHTEAHGDCPSPEVIDPAMPPIRPERHVLNSIATVRRRLTVALARGLRAMSVLRNPHPQAKSSHPFMTQ